MLFKVKADVTFEATDIMDALNKLGEHFSTVAQAKESNLFLAESVVEIAPQAWPITQDTNIAQYKNTEALV